MKNAGSCSTSSPSTSAWPRWELFAKDSWYICWTTRIASFCWTTACKTDWTCSPSIAENWSSGGCYRREITVSWWSWKSESNSWTNRLYFLRFCRLFGSTSNSWRRGGSTNCSSLSNRSQATVSKKKITGSVFFSDVCYFIFGVMSRGGWRCKEVQRGGWWVGLEEVPCPSG